MAQVPEKAREFLDEVGEAVRRCEAGEVTGAECLKELHSLTCSRRSSLYRAFKEEAGDPVPKVEVVTVPLACPGCGGIHLGEEMERFWAAGGEGDCPKRRSRRRAR